jgi:hypothetical protein
MAALATMGLAAFANSAMFRMLNGSFKADTMPFLSARFWKIPRQILRFYYGRQRPKKSSP